MKDKIIKIVERTWQILGILCIITFSIILAATIIKDIRDKQATLDKYNKESSYLNSIQKTIEVTYPSLGIDAAKVYGYAIYHNAKKYKLDTCWQIIPAIIFVESGVFNHKAISNKNAKGAMQILESTAQEICQELGITYEKDYTLWNIIDNINIGSKYLADGITNHGFIYGIKRYNCGNNFKDTISDKYAKKVLLEYTKLKYISTSTLIGK